MELANKEYNLRKILDLLCEITLSEEQRDELVSSLCIYFRKSYRHNYHEITRYVIEKYTKPSEEETVLVMLDNIDLLLSHIKSMWNCQSVEQIAPRDCVELDRPGEICEVRCSSGLEFLDCRDCKNIYRFVIKLKDHIFLEFLRIAQIVNENERVESQIEAIQEKEYELASVAEELEDSSQEVILQVSALSEEVRNVYVQMVTILGIFTAIMVAIFGGLNTVAQIVRGLSIRDTLSLINVLFSVSLTETFVLDMIFVLIVFISKLRKDIKIPGIVIGIIVGINIFCIIVIGFAIHTFGTASN